MPPILLILILTSVNILAQYQNYEEYDQEWWPPDRREDQVDMEYEEVQEPPRALRAPTNKPKKKCELKQTFDMETFFQPLIKYAIRIYTRLYVLYIDNYEAIVGIYRFALRIYSVLHGYLLQGLYYSRLVLDESAKIMEKQQTTINDYEYKLRTNRRSWAITNVTWL